MADRYENFPSHRPMPHPGSVPPSTEGAPETCDYLVGPAWGADPCGAKLPCPRHSLPAPPSPVSGEGLRPHEWWPRTRRDGNREWFDGYSNCAACGAPPPRRITDEPTACPGKPALSPSEGATPHPEAACQSCGGPNVVWFAPNDVWNRVMGGEAGIVCPTCFVRAAEQAGIVAVWRLAPDSPAPAPTAGEPGDLDELERVAKANGYHHHIAPWIAALSAERVEKARISDALAFDEELIVRMRGQIESLRAARLQAEVKAEQAADNFDMITKAWHDEQTARLQAKQERDALLKAAKAVIEDASPAGDAKYHWVSIELLDDLHNAIMEAINEPKT